MNAPTYKVTVWYPSTTTSLSSKTYDDVSDFWQTADMFRFVDPATGRNVVLSGIPFVMVEQPRKP